MFLLPRNVQNGNVNVEKFANKIYKNFSTFLVLVKAYLKKYIPSRVPPIDNRKILKINLIFARRKQVRNEEIIQDC